MKAHILSTLKGKNKNLPRTTFDLNSLGRNPDYANLAAIFESDDDDSEFLGFDVCNLNRIFDSDDEDTEFFGFNVCNLNHVFASDDSDSEFFGFESGNLNEIFNNTFDEDYTFLGF